MRRWRELPGHDRAVRLTMAYVFVGWLTVLLVAVLD